MAPPVDEASSRRMTDTHTPRWGRCALRLLRDHNYRPDVRLGLFHLLVALFITSLLASTDKTVTT